MPHRTLAVTSRQHPIAIGTYFAIVLLSMLYLFARVSSAAMINEVGEGVTHIWEILLGIGGGIAIVAVFLPSQLLPLALRLEALGALLIGVELGVYSLVMWFGLDSAPWTTIIIFLSISISCLVRTYTANRDRNKVIKAFRAMTPADPPPLAEAGNE